MGGSGSPESAVFTREIRVLLVDPDKEYLLYLAELLRSCSCKVKTVERATTALAILSERKEDFDLLIVDIQSPDLDLFTLLRLTNNMDVLAMPMSADKDDAMVRKAFEIGALLVIEKPVTGETLKYMWQLVMREKAKMGIKLVDEDRSASETTGKNDKRCNESKGKMPQQDIVSETINKKDKHVPKKRGRGRKFRKNDEDSKSINYYNGRVKKKACTEWTEELHQKFIDAVNQLGEGRCYPKDILALMNVPGLTRMQVASHLQKCRNDNWRAPEVRKTNPCGSNPTSSGIEGSALKIYPRKFGSMPFLPKEANDAHVNLQEDNTALQTPSANKLSLVNLQDEPENHTSPQTSSANNLSLVNLQHENHTASETSSANNLSNDNGIRDKYTEQSTNPFNPNCSIQYMEQHPEYGNLDTVQTMDYTDNVVEATVNYAENVVEATVNYAENVVEATVNYDINPNEMSNLNVNVNEDLVVPARMVDHQNYCHPILSDLNSVTPGIDHFHSSSSILKHPSDDLFDFLPEMDDFMKNYPGFAEASVNNQSSETQQCVFGFDKVFSPQPLIDSNGQNTYPMNHIFEV